MGVAVARVALLAVLLSAGGAATVASAHTPAEPAWRSVMQGTCSYYAAYYLGADCGRAGGDESLGTFAAQGTDPAVFEGPVPRADCGPGSRPEPAIQGEVPQADRDGGRSVKGYACNLEVVGNYAGEGSTWSAAYYGHCAYYATNCNGTQRNRGVVVVDVSDPAHPKFSTTLTSIAMLARTSRSRSTRSEDCSAAVTGGELRRPASFDVYDVEEDCAHPRLLGSIPQRARPRGQLGAGRAHLLRERRRLPVTAIDVSDPARRSRSRTSCRHSV